ncbi:MAG: RHS repeat-associated core domain-containing protein [Pseudomonadota bacterium]|nr:RHS repeat-associated core domain-containing protein [Pseudomonadota bacterium]
MQGLLPSDVSHVVFENIRMKTIQIDPPYIRQTNPHGVLACSLVYKVSVPLNASSSSESSGDSPFNERLWCLMDYYDPTSTVNDVGEVVERYRFSAFGLRTILTPDFESRSTSLYEWNFAFKGQFLDADTGYYNYGYRYYSPELGRWLSRDPIGEEGGANLYLMASNSPVNEIDKLGLQIELDINWKPPGVWQGGILTSTIDPNALSNDISLFTAQPGSSFTGKYIIKETSAWWGIYKCVFNGGNARIPFGGKNRYYCSFDCDELLSSVDGSPPSPLVGEANLSEDDSSTCLRCVSTISATVYKGYGSPAAGYSSASTYIMPLGSILKA